MKRAQRLGQGGWLFVPLLMGLLGAASAAAQQEQWQVGLAAVRITPDEPVRMAGYAGRTEPSAGVASDLHAKALVLDDGRGGRGVIVTADVIGFQSSLADSICEQIQKQTGLQREQILLNASHTHTGPTLALASEEQEASAEETAATIRYTEGLRQKIVQIVVEALDRLQPAQLSWGIGVAEFVMNRREFTDEGVILGFNPRGHVDRSVPVLRVASPDGKPLAVLFGAACHNTTLGSKDLQISGDFAGYAQAEIERAMPGTQAMFMQGCAGDANPFPRGEEAIARRHGRTLADEVARVLESELQEIDGPLQTRLQMVDLPLQSQLTKAEIQALGEGDGGWRSFVAERMLTALETKQGLAESYAAPVAVWQLGDDLTLVGLSGEVVAEYVTLLEDALGPQRLWVAAYCNDVFGYLPSARTLQQGGYETRGLYRGGVGLFSPQAQDVLVEQVQDLVAEMRGGKSKRGKSK